MLTTHPMTALERRVVAALALLYSFRMLGLFMALPLLALYAADMLGASPLMIGVALGAYGATQALLQIPLGWLSDKIGRKPVILGGLALFVLGSVVAALAESVPMIAVGRALQGAGAISGSVMALAADLTSEEQRTKAMAVIGISIGLSFALALICGPLLAAWGGLAAVFWMTAALAVLGMAIVLLGIPSAVARTHEGVGADRNMFRPVLKDPVLQRLNGSVFLLHFMLTASFLVVPAVIEGSMGVPRDSHWRVYLPVLVVSLLGMYPFLRLSERGGRPGLALKLTVLIMPLSLAALFLGKNTLLLYAALCGFFTAVNYLEAALPSLVSKAVFAHGKGTAMGIYATCQFLGAFAGGTTGGLVYGSGGLPALLWLVIAAAILWLLLIWRIAPRSESGAAASAF
ncbi:Arabinose efflux permease [Congregibacter litoralis KT71]|uniref:Arabinose efflux permease n=2 Tax=Congregibacter TaxID=393661 RepID=A4A657_9GAMM|nr:Arabinose efflux permease [Congregibacter litoralis KT71]